VLKRKPSEGAKRFQRCGSTPSDPTDQKPAENRSVLKAKELFKEIRPSYGDGCQAAAPVEGLLDGARDQQAVHVLDDAVRAHHHVGPRTAQETAAPSSSG